jgi:hypothetical protein
MKETRVFKYGCRAPTEQGDLVSKSMWLGHRYQNELTAIELARRTAYRNARSKLPAMEPLEAKVAGLVAELEAARSEIKKTRAKARKNVDISALRPRAASLGLELRAARAEVKALREVVARDPELAAHAKAIDEAAHAKMIQARKACGVYWGTYLLAEAAAEASRKVKGFDPSFHRWRGDGRIGVQVQGGMTIEQLYACKDTRLRIEPVPFTAHEGKWAEPRWQRRFIKGAPMRSGAARISRRTGQPVVAQQGVMTRLWIRVGSQGPKSEPIWAIFPLYLHRPLPPDAVIKEVTVNRRYIGTHARWSCHLTIVRDNVEALPQRPGVVAVNIGWRNRLEGNLRVGYHVDDKGERGQFLMLASIRARLAHAEHLRSIQDKLFDEIKGRLGLWLAEQTTLPEWTDPLRTLDKWRSQARLTAIVKQWRDARLPGDEAIFLELEAWRKQARHLYQWESWERTRALDHRKHTYRNIAANLAREYGTLILHQFNIMDVKEKHKTEDKAKDAAPPQRKQLQQGAPGELRLALKHAFAARGGVVLELPSVNITKRCHACKELCVFDAAASVMHTCEHCRTTWDQDDNACMNLLSDERSGGDESPEASREPEDDKDSGDLLTSQQALLHLAT